MSAPLSDSIREQFKIAVERNQADTVADLCRAHADLRECIDEPWFSFGTPAIVLAAGRGQISLVDALLDAGSDVNVESDWQPGPYTALHHVTYGAQHLDLRMAEHLIARGAVIDIHAAAGLGRLELVEELLEANPTLLHKRGPDGQMPLSVAGTIEVAKLLVDRGAEIDSRCIDHGSTPAQYCVRNRPEITRFLLSKGARPDIFMAAAIGESSLFKTLLEDNPARLHMRIDETTCAVESPSEGGNIYFYTLGCQGTLLHVAARCNQALLIEILHTAGIALDTRGDYDECTALHIAAWEDTVASAQKLIDLGAALEIESGENHRNTPLGWAIVAGSQHVAKVLIDAGAEIRDYYIRTTHEGEAGEFSPFAPRATKENYIAIRSLLEKAS